MTNNSNSNSSLGNRKRRRSDRYKTLSRSELYKDRHLANREYKEQVSRTIQEQPLTENQRNNFTGRQEPVEQQISINREKAPLRQNPQPEEDYLYDPLRKKGR